MKFMMLSEVAERMLDAQELEEILYDNNLMPYDVILHLLKAGLIEVPEYCESPDIEEED